RRRSARRVRSRASSRTSSSAASRRSRHAAPPTGPRCSPRSTPPPRATSAPEVAGGIFSRRSRRGPRMMADAARRFERLGLSLTAEQRLVADAARDFATRRLAAGAAERDRTGAFPREELAELASLGLLAMKVPADDGGAGTD